MKYSLEQFANCIKKSSEHFANLELSKVFSSEGDSFERAALEFSGEFELPSNLTPLHTTSHLRGIEITLDVFPKPSENSWDIHLSVGYPKNESELRPSRVMIKRLVTRRLLAYFSENVLPNPFISTSERLGIALFYRDLDSNRNALVEQLQGLASSSRKNKRIDPFDLIQKATSRFALPVHENIDFVRGLSDVQKGNSSIESINLGGYIEKMMGGAYRVEDEQIMFSNNKRGVKRVRIPLHLGSSSLRSLTDIFFYLRYVAEVGDLLMVDEPESHLTPQNQVILARMLAATVNAGVRVFITTHSDYLIREINNLIMLGGIPESGREKLFKELGYESSEILKAGDVAAYVCKNGRTEPCDFSPYGIEIKNIDEAIEDLNERTNLLAGLVAIEQEAKSLVG